MSRPVAYGQVCGSDFAASFPAGASVSFNANSGKFVCMSSSYLYLVGTASKSDIVGWAQAGTMSTQSTAGRDLISVLQDRDGIYEMPLSRSFTETELKSRLGLTCDITVTDNIQTASISSSTYDQLQIVGYKYYGDQTGEQSVLVRLYGSNLTYTGVA